MTADIARVRHLEFLLQSVMRDGDYEAAWRTACELACSEAYVKRHPDILVMLSKIEHLHAEQRAAAHEARGSMAPTERPGARPMTAEFEKPGP